MIHECLFDRRKRVKAFSSLTDKNMRTSLHRGVDTLRIRVKPYFILIVVI